MGSLAVCLSVGIIPGAILHIDNNIFFCGQSTKSTYTVEWLSAGDIQIGDLVEISPVHPPPPPETQFKIQSFSRNINIQISAGERLSAISLTTTVDPFLLN